MLKAGVGNGLHQLGLEQKVAETGRGDAGVRAPATGARTDEHTANAAKRRHGGIGGEDAGGRWNKQIAMGLVRNWWVGKRNRGREEDRQVNGRATYL